MSPGASGHDHPDEAPPDQAPPDQAPPDEAPPDEASARLQQLRLERERLQDEVPRRLRARMASELADVDRQFDEQRRERQRLEDEKLRIQAEIARLRGELLAYEQYRQWLEGHSAEDETAGRRCVFQRDGPPA